MFQQLGREQMLNMITFKKNNLFQIQSPIIEKMDFFFQIDEKKKKKITGTGTRSDKCKWLVFIEYHRYW